MEPADGPPINEVAMSISFDEQDVLAGPKLLVALRQLTSRYPEIEEQLPYEMPDELPTKSQLTRPPGANFQFVVPGGPTKRRYWLTETESKSILVQVQSDYFAVNWRSRPEGQHYPGFARLKEVFFEALTLLNEAVAGRGGADLVIHQAELTYVNVIKPQADFADRSFVSDYLDVKAPFLDDLEQLNFTYTRSLENSEGSFFGRSYAAIQTAYEIKDLSSLAHIDLSAVLELDPILNVNISVRSARHKNLNLEDLAGVFEQAHVEATNSFRSVTTVAAQKSWGLT